MWRLALLTAIVLVLGTSTAMADRGPDDFECVTGGDQCHQPAADSGDRFDSSSAPSTDRHSDLPRSNFDRHYGVRVFGLTGPASTTSLKATDADPAPRGTDVIRLHGDTTRPDARAADRPHTPVTREQGQPVLRLGDDQPYEPIDDGTDSGADIETDDDGQRVIRLHEDDEDVDDETVTEIQTGDQNDDEAVDESIDDGADISQFVRDYMGWEFIPAIDVLEADGAVTDVDVQRTLNADQEGIADCFQARDYPGHGSMVVDLNLSYNGIVEAVSGTTDGIEPGQARCILERAWRYEFPRLADEADTPSQISYRVEFIGQPVDVPDGDPDNPHLFLERLRTSQPAVDEAVRTELLDQLDTLELCASGGLDQLPTDLVATEVHVGWLQSEPGTYRPSMLDATIHNKTSTERPSQQVVDCYKQRLQNMTVELDDRHIDEIDEFDDIDELPDELTGSFWVTVRPAGWTGI